jgi:hypothetical protein
VASTAVSRGGPRKARRLAVGKFQGMLGSRAVRARTGHPTASRSWEDDISSRVPYLGVFGRKG